MEPSEARQVKARLPVRPKRRDDPAGARRPSVYGHAAPCCWQPRREVGENPADADDRARGRRTHPRGVVRAPGPRGSDLDGNAVRGLGRVAGPRLARHTAPSRPGRVVWRSSRRVGAWLHEASFAKRRIRARLVVELPGMQRTRRAALRVGGKLSRASGRRRRSGEARSGPTEATSRNPPRRRRGAGGSEGAAIAARAAALAGTGRSAGPAEGRRPRWGAARAPSPSTRAAGSRNAPRRPPSLRGSCGRTRSGCR